MDKSFDINDYKPVTHPLKGILKQHGVSTATIANYLGNSYTYVCNILNGQYRMPVTMHDKLLELVNKLNG